MDSTATRPRGAHLVGSVPLEDAEQVFRAAANALGKHLRRIPDGETGARSTWIAWQAQFLAQHPELELEPPPPGQYAPLQRFRLKDERGGDRLRFPDGIGYAEAGRASYAAFARLKDAGTIPADVRFQVSLPTPLAPVTQFVSHRDQATIEPAYEHQMLGEVAQLCEAIPHDQLAIQWDVAIEMGMLEGIGGLFQTWFEPVEDGIVERLVRYAEAVPAGVELGFHLCYGDYGHEHFTEPTDAATLTRLSNRLADGIARRIDWIHMPVPRARADEAYFAPLTELRLDSETELYLGVVHITDGVDGAQRRIAGARASVADFGVGTECGFGRRPPETVHALLELHAAVAEPVRES